MYGISISSNWYAYEYYYKMSPLSQNLTDWWHELSVVGAAVNFIFLLLDCCCCCCDVKEKAIQNAMALASFFVTVLLGDLPLLVLTLRSIYEISNDQLCERSDDVLFFFKLRSVIFLIVSLFHLIKVCVLNCTCDEIDRECSKCLFCFYFSYFALSITIVCTCGYAIYVCYA